MLDRFETEPDLVLAELHVNLKPDDEDRLFVLAELSFLHAQRTDDRAYYLASAAYAWSLLYPEDGKGIQIPPSDPRNRLSYALYNQAIALGLAAEDDAAEENEVRLKAGHYPLPFGTLDLGLMSQVCRGRRHCLSVYFQLIVLDVDGLRNRYLKPGVGAPLAASLAKSTSSQKKLGADRLGPYKSARYGIVAV